MMVGGKGASEFFVAHDNKGDAIGQRPIFVGASGVESKAFFQQRSRGGDYTDGGAKSLSVNNN